MRVAVTGATGGTERATAVDPGRLALAACLLDGVLAIGIGLVAAANRSGPPLDVVPRAPLLAAILLAPALVGAIGAWTGTRVLLLAAGVVGFLKAGIAFSGVTLVFLLPAVLYLRAASSAELVSRSAVAPRRLLLVMVLAVPVVVAVLLTVGVLALPLLIILALVPAFRRRGGARDRAMSGTSLLLGGAIVAVLLATLNGIAGWTETVCWTGRQTPSGTVYERVPETNTFTLGPNEVGGGCDSGIPTPEGVARVAGLVALAVLLALLAVRASRPDDPLGGSLVGGTGDIHDAGPAASPPDPRGGGDVVASDG